MNKGTALAGRSRAISDLDPGKLRRWRQTVRMLTQAELGKYAGLSRGEISHLETGRRKPLATTLRRLCIALECEPDDLLVTRIAEENQNGSKSTQQDQSADA